MIRALFSFDWAGVRRTLGVIGWCFAFGMLVAACEEHRKVEPITLGLGCFRCNLDSGVCEEISCDATPEDARGDEAAL